MSNSYPMSTSCIKQHMSTLTYIYTSPHTPASHLSYSHSHHIYIYIYIYIRHTVIIEKSGVSCINVDSLIASVKSKKSMRLRNEMTPKYPHHIFTWISWQSHSQHPYFCSWSWHEQKLMLILHINIDTTALASQHQSFIHTTSLYLPNNDCSLTTGKWRNRWDDIICKQS